MKKSIDIDKLKKEVKQQKKVNNNMKRTIILTVITTLLVIVSLVGTFLLGVSYEKGINNRIQAEAQALKNTLSIVKEDRPLK